MIQGYNSTFEYIGASLDSSEGEQLFAGFSFIFTMPAIVMTCLSSRLILIWLFNICASCSCLTLSQVLASDVSFLYKKINKQFSIKNFILIFTNIMYFQFIFIYLFEKTSLL